MGQARTGHCECTHGTHRLPVRVRYRSSASSRNGLHITGLCIAISCTITCVAAPAPRVTHREREREVLGPIYSLLPGWLASDIATGG
jgi:hypothetical protein